MTTAVCGMDTGTPVGEAGEHEKEIASEGAIVALAAANTTTEIVMVANYCVELLGIRTKLSNELRNEEKSLMYGRCANTITNTRRFFSKRCSSFGAQGEVHRRSTSREVLKASPGDVDDG